MHDLTMTRLPDPISHLKKNHLEEDPRVWVIVQVDIADVHMIQLEIEVYFVDLSAPIFAHEMI